MKTKLTPFKRYAISAFAASFMLSGCGGSLAQVASPGVMQARPITPQAAHDKSWMLPEAVSQDLLYVANNNGTVTVYSYPQGKMVGTLLGFDLPEGECVDSSGHVFITVFALHQIREYAHGGTKPIAILRDPGSDPFSCSVDPTTGDLAVANYLTNGLEGHLAIYHKAKGTPKIFSTNIESLFCGYDNRGNLFAGGYDASGRAALVELPKGSRKFANIELNEQMVVGAVQWDGKYLAIGNGYLGNRMEIYRFSIAHGIATKKGAVTLIGSDTIVFWIQGSTVAALNDYANVGIWRYPRSGYPTKIIYNGVASPHGLAVSLAPH